MKGLTFKKIKSYRYKMASRWRYIIAETLRDAKQLLSRKGIKPLRIEFYKHLFIVSDESTQKVKPKLCSRRWIEVGPC